MPGLTRIDPVGSKLDDGYSTKITFTADPDVSFWEKSVKPPGVDGGDPIDITTMFNAEWRTAAPRSLKTLTEASATVAYDPQVYDQIVALINVKTWVTILFSDGSGIHFPGYLKSFEPGELSEGGFPEATISIVPTNADPSTGVETGVDYVVAGTPD
jgi:hypothetical protein